MKKTMLAFMLAMLCSLSYATGNSQSSKFKPFPNIKTEIAECIHWGTGVRLTVRFTNTSEQDIKLLLEDQGTYDLPYQSFFYDKNGNKSKALWAIPSATDQGIRQFSVEVPGGLSIIGHVFVEGNVSPADTMFARIDLRGRLGNDYYTTYQLCKQNNVKITRINNTNNRQYVKCTLPVLGIGVQECKRVGNNVEISFSAYTYPGNTLPNYLDQRNTIAYDEAGNDYKSIAMTFDGKPKAYGAQITGDAKVQGKIIIKNVPATVKKFNLVKSTFTAKMWGITDDYKVEIKSLTVN